MKVWGTYRNGKTRDLSCLARNLGQAFIWKEIDILRAHVVLSGTIKEQVLVATDVRRMWQNNELSRLHNKKRGSSYCGW